MRFIVCAAIALACTSLRAQTPPATPQFEVASVRPTAQDDRAGSRLAQVLRSAGRNNRRPGEIPMTGPDRVHLENWALLDLIAAAYSVRASQVSGPVWLSDQVFDIEAKVPDDTPKDELNVMLQSLLEERFGLKMHRATKTAQGFALTVGKNGPNLKSARPPPVPDPTLTQEEQMAQSQQNMLADLAASKKRMQEDIANGKSVVGQSSSASWNSITTEELAARLVRFAEAPVVDETGLTGKYTVTIGVSTRPDGSGDTVFDAVEKLGLKLEPRKVTVETVVVDQVSKTPTAN
jgi:uncharacterized protein (TIGR03435 family)